MMELVAAVAAGALLGIAIGWLLAKRSTTGLKDPARRDRKAPSEERTLLDKATHQLSDTFRALAADALHQNNDGFLALATERLGSVRSEAASELEARKKEIETLVKPLGESLAEMTKQIRSMEKDRSTAYGTLTEQVKSLISTQDLLRSETGNLVKALRAPIVRGRWGEIQLKRVVESGRNGRPMRFFPTTKRRDGQRKTPTRHARLSSRRKEL